MAGMLLIGAGLLHISAAADHTNLPVMTIGFLIVASLQAALGGLLLVRRANGLLLAGALTLTLGALAAWLVSRTVGLPLLPGGHMEPIGFKDGVTVLFELGTLPLLAVLLSSEIDRVRLPSPRLGTRAVSVLGGAMFALFVPAFLLGGGEHHSASELAAHHGGGSDPDGDHPHGEELAQAGGGHLHDEGHRAHGATDARPSGGGSHAHGRKASASVFANAHRSATGHAHDGGAASAGGHGASREGDGATRTGHAHTGDGGSHGGGHRDPTSDTERDHGHDEHSRRGGGDTRGGGHHEHGDGHKSGGDDHGHGGHGDGGEDHATPAGNDRAIALESGHPEGGGRPARSPGVVIYDQPNEQVNGAGHSHSAEPCKPTAAQQAAADTLARDVRAELRQYENNPAEALADGFDYVFGPTDRMIHVVDLDRVNDPDVLKVAEIESFIYYMTDTGFVPIGGMFIMPEYGMSGPEPGGCLTKWHRHGGIIGRWATAGTRAETPEMMHVFTYPGLDPWGHYTGRDLAPLWTPGRWLPSVCRSSGDANDGCLP